MGDAASDDDSNMKTYKGVQRRAEAREHYRMSPSLRRHDKILSERDAAIIIQGVASVWFGRLEVAYRRALDAFPSPARRALVAQHCQHWVQQQDGSNRSVGNARWPGRQFSAAHGAAVCTSVAYRPRLRMAMARIMLLLLMLSN